MAQQAGSIASSGARRRSFHSDFAEKGDGEKALANYVPGPEPLFERLGGPQTLQQVVNIFYDKLLADEELAPFFEGLDVDTIRMHQYRFMLMALGGPKQYDGRTLYDAHRNLRRFKGLRERHFDLVVAYLQASLRQLGTPKPLVAEVTAILGPTKPSIFPPSEDEDGNKIVSEHPGCACTIS